MAVLSTPAVVLGSSATSISAFQSSLTKTKEYHVLSNALKPLYISTGSAVQYYWS